MTTTASALDSRVVNPSTMSGRVSTAASHPRRLTWATSASAIGPPPAITIVTPGTSTVRTRESVMSTVGPPAPNAVASSLVADAEVVTAIWVTSSPSSTPSMITGSRAISAGHTSPGNWAAGTTRNSTVDPAGSPLVLASHSSTRCRTRRPVGSCRAAASASRPVNAPLASSPRFPPPGVIIKASLLAAGEIIQATSARVPARAHAATLNATSYIRPSPFLAPGPTVYSRRL